MCQQKDETVTHLVSECSKMVQSEYKGRHNRVAAEVHWGLAKKYGYNILRNGMNLGQMLRAKIMRQNYFRSAP